MSSGVDIKFADDGVLANIACYDKDGNEVPLPHRIVVTPVFTRPDARITLMRAVVYGDIESQSNEVYRGVVQLHGSTGRIASVPAQESMQPKFATSQKPNSSPAVDA